MLILLLHHAFLGNLVPTEKESQVTNKVPVIKNGMDMPTITAGEVSKNTVNLFQQYIFSTQIWFGECI